MAAPALKNLKEVVGDFDIVFQPRRYTELISCHFSLIIFAYFWNLGGQVPPGPNHGAATGTVLLEFPSYEVLVFHS